MCLKAWLSVPLSIDNLCKTDLLALCPGGSVRPHHHLNKSLVLVFWKGPVLGRFLGIALLRVNKPG